jgi:hypothetical protein
MRITPPQRRTVFGMESGVETLGSLFREGITV